MFDFFVAKTLPSPESNLADTLNFIFAETLVTNPLKKAAEFVESDLLI